MKIHEAANPETYRLKRENADLRAALVSAIADKTRDAEVEDFIRSATRARLRAPAWTLPHREHKRHLVMPVVCFSDWHLDEVVNPAEVDNRNGYNREIAEARFKTFVEGTIRVARDYVHGFTYPGLVMPWLGDNLSGDIHEELKETNADTLLGSLLHWVEPVAAGLRVLAKEFGQVFCPVVVGNHGRTTRKPIAKRRAKSNFDWLFANMVRLTLERAGERRVSWSIPESQKQIVSILDTRFLLSHGDEAKGGSGIAGMLSPQLIAFSRMKKTYVFDQWLLGHWHNRSAYRGIRVNGSGKGFDEYSMVSNFDFQRPCQDFFLVAPGNDHPVIADWPIFVDSKDEPWRTNAH